MTLDLWQLRERAGGRVYDDGRRWIGPGPGHSRFDRSLSVRIADDGRPLLYSFSGDGFRECADHLGIDAEPDRTRQLCRPPPQREPPKQDPRALALWREARADGEIIGAYLQRRGIMLAVPPSLRQGCGLALGRTPVPTMVAAVQLPDGRVAAAQQTFLTWAGAKAPLHTPRLTTGRLYDGAWRAGLVEAVMGLAEGVETALAAMQLSGVTCWASLGAERLPLVRLPASVRELHVFADADPTGQRKAREAAERHRKRGLGVYIRTPPEGFGDWADLAAARRT